MVDQENNSGQNAERETKDRDGKRKSTVEWNDERMETNFANVVNVQGTQEQVELFFGTNRTWNVNPDSPVKVDLSNRLILTPHAAKRMCNILTGVLREYEARHGVLKLND